MPGIASERTTITADRGLVLELAAIGLDIARVTGRRPTMAEVIRMLAESWRESRAPGSRQVPAGMSEHASQEREMT